MPPPLPPVWMRLMTWWGGSVDDNHFRASGDESELAIGSELETVCAAGVHFEGVGDLL